MRGVGDDVRIAGVGKWIADPEDRYGRHRRPGPSVGHRRRRVRVRRRGQSGRLQRHDQPFERDRWRADTSRREKGEVEPDLNTSFEGLNFYQQRYARGGNQFSIEPPDQGLCVGNGFELEAINDVVNVYNASGQSVLPDNTATNIVGGFPRNVNHAVDLNSFYGYPPAVDRTTGADGPELTDPSCSMTRRRSAGSSSC